MSPSLISFIFSICQISAILADGLSIIKKDYNKHGGACLDI
jgi:hypothetical protein